MAPPSISDLLEKYKNFRVVHKDDLRNIPLSKDAIITTIKNNGELSKSIPVSKFKSEKFRRIRSAFTTSQITVLETEFKRSPFVNSERKRALAIELGFSERVIKVWFQNRRMKEKIQKAQKLHECDSDAGLVMLHEETKNNQYPRINLHPESINNVETQRNEDSGLYSVYKSLCNKQNRITCKGHSNLNQNFNYFQPQVETTKSYENDKRAGKLDIAHKQTNNNLNTINNLYPESTNNVERQRNEDSGLYSVYKSSCNKQNCITCKRHSNLKQNFNYFKPYETKAEAETKNAEKSYESDSSNGELVIALEETNNDPNSRIDLNLDSTNDVERQRNEDTGLCSVYKSSCNKQNCMTCKGHSNLNQNFNYFQPHETKAQTETKNATKSYENDSSDGELVIELEETNNDPNSRIDLNPESANDVERQRNEDTGLCSVYKSSCIKQNCITCKRHLNLNQNFNYYQPNESKAQAELYNNHNKGPYAEIIIHNSVIKPTNQINENSKEKYGDFTSKNSVQDTTNTRSNVPNSYNLPTTSLPNLSWDYNPRSTAPPHYPGHYDVPGRSNDRLEELPTQTVTPNIKKCEKCNCITDTSNQTTTDIPSLEFLFAQILENFHNGTRSFRNVN